MDMISTQGGILIYLRQEGRGIGLINKMEAYKLQDQGLDTIQANIHLGFQPDERDFGVAIHILEDLGVSSIQLLTNNPEKMAAIDQSSLHLAGRVPLVIPSNADNAPYMKTKQQVMGHLL
jgi:3,4-dihydroxy 2-butanone 4-phosphate synthase/GTP cyclohydrolase II